MLAHLIVVENYSRTVMSEYVNQFVSSVEVIGAALVTNGNCSLDEPSIEMNVSIRVPSSKSKNCAVSLSFNHNVHMHADNSTDVRDSVANIATISKQVLNLPPETIATTQSQETIATTQSQEEPNSVVDLVIGLVVAAVILTLLSLAVAVLVLIWCNKTKR